MTYLYCRTKIHLFKFIIAGTSPAMTLTVGLILFDFKGQIMFVM